MMKKLLASLTAFAAVFLMASMAFAQTAGGPKGYETFLAIAVALGIGLAAFAGALGQGKVAAATLEGIARNPNAADRLFVPMILGLAFIESLVLFTWVLMLLMQQKM
jgi:F-type H+-transporting ATPase subunit c